MSEKELKNFSVEDLGTEKDSQYRTAEGTLLKQLNRTQTGTTYQPGRANLSYALP
jgi:carboxyl-terminal processing protease